MHFFLFMVLGILDVFALFALMFKAFRLPYVEYAKEIGIIAVVITLISYVIRVFFAGPQLLDIMLHFVLYILFFRLLIKIRVWRGFIVALVYFGYGLLSFVSYMLLYKTHIISGDLSPNSLSSYLVQVTQIALAFIISFVLYRFNLGFSFIVRPPHDFFIKRVLKRNEVIMINGILILSAVMFACAFMIFEYKNFMIIPFNLAIFALLIYLAYRRDSSRG
jgi:hypothetical protein